MKRLIAWIVLIAIPCAVVAVILFSFRMAGIGPLESLAAIVAICMVVIIVGLITEAIFWALENIRK